MLTSITPLGERGRRRRWAPTAAAYVLGSTAGGALVGIVAGLAGAATAALLRPGAPLLAGMAAFACVLCAGGDLVGRPVPSIHRQVNPDWLSSYRGWVGGLGFGVQLGIGVVTIVTTATVYLMVTLTVLVSAAEPTVTASLGRALAIGAAFGLTRSLPILVVARAHRPQQLASVGRRLAHWTRQARWGTVLAVSGAAAAYALLAVGSLAGAT